MEKDKINKESKEKKIKEENLIHSGLAGANHEINQRYGAAVKEHLVAYSGMDNENGKILQKSLKSIQNQKENDEYAFQISQQKAGWAAEVKDTAESNAENIIQKQSKRKIRHDDLKDTPANHPLYDHVEIDQNGNIIAGSGSQMKFIGASSTDSTGAGNAERALNKLQSKEFQKYIDNDVKIEVPKDEYQKMLAVASEQLDSLQKQLERAKASGNKELVEKLEKKIDNLNKLKKNLKPSKLTRKQSLEAAKNPEISTLKSIANVSHRAGVEAAKNSALIGGSISLVRNIVDTYRGDLDIDEAALNIAKDTAASTALGYATGFSGSAIKGFMQNSNSMYTRALAKTNVASTIVSITISATKTLNRYFKGEIDGQQCMEDLGEQGTGMIASALFTVIGQAAIPIPVVGGLIGGMIGYALSSASYGVLMSSLKEAKLAHEERIEIEKVCNEHVEMIREYRAQIDSIIEEYLSDKMKIFNDSFDGIKNALEIGNIDVLIENANTITESLGGEKPFENIQDFKNKLLMGETFYL